MLRIGSGSFDPETLVILETAFDKLRGFAMGQAIPVRTNYTAGEVRRFAQRAKDAAQARRLLAIAAGLDGASREEAAKIGGMDRQTLRDWVIRFNEQGADGLINIPSPGVPPKLNSRHKAFLARIVDEGPIPAIHGVVRWRACDLIMRLHEEFGLSVSDDTIYRALKTLGFSHVSARPKAYKQSAEAVDAFKKTSETPRLTPILGMGAIRGDFGGAPVNRRPDWLAGHVRLELRNVVANYPFERSHRFPEIQPKFWPRRLFAFELRRSRYAARTGFAASGSSSDGTRSRPIRAFSATPHDGQRPCRMLAEDPGRTQSRDAYPGAAAQTRVVSKARIRLDSRKSTRLFKGIICDDISEFESHMPSHAVRSLPANVPARLERQAGMLDEPRPAG
jgi:transposase